MLSVRDRDETDLWKGRGPDQKLHVTSVFQTLPSRRRQSQHRNAYASEEGDQEEEVPESQGDASNS
jgi:hypothetical protein